MLSCGFLHVYTDFYCLKKSYPFNFFFFFNRTSQSSVGGGTDVAQQQQRSQPSVRKDMESSGKDSKLLIGTAPKYNEKKNLCYYNFLNFACKKR